MKILLIGEIYSSNLGDPIICDCVKYLIKNTYPNCEFSFYDTSARVDFNQNYNSDDNKSFNLKNNIRINTIFSLYSYKIKINTQSDYFKFKNIFTQSNKNLAMSICEEDYDLAVFVGGQLFMDYFVFPISYIVELLSMKNTPIIFNSCGVGPIKNNLLIYKLKQSLTNKNVKVISSRDYVNIIKKLYLQDSEYYPIKTYDPALYTPNVYNIKKSKSDIIGLGIMEPTNTSTENLISFWKNIIDSLNKQGLKWMIFCNGNISDYNFSKIILLNCGYSENQFESYLCFRPIYPIELVEIISRFNCIISFRLHSHIVAYSLNIPSIALVWDNKLNYFFNNINCADRCFDINSSTSDIIDKLLQVKDTYYDQVIFENQKKVLHNILINSINSSLKYRKLR